MQHPSLELLNAKDPREVHAALREVESSCQEMETALGSIAPGSDDSYPSALRAYLDALQSFRCGSAAEFEAAAALLARWRQSRDPRICYLFGRGCCLLARHLCRRGNLAGAGDHALRAEVVADTISFSCLKAEALEIRSRIESAGGDWGLAETLASQALGLYLEDPGDLPGQARSWEARGLAQFEAGNFDEAQRRLDNSMQLWHRCSDGYGQADTQLLSAHLFYHMREDERCESLLAGTETLCRRLPYERGLGTVARYRGKLALHSGSRADAPRLLGEAIRDFGESLAIFCRAGDPAGSARAHLSLARAHAECQRWDEALADYSAAEALFSEMKDEVRTAAALVTRGVLLARQAVAERGAADEIERKLPALKQVRDRKFEAANAARFTPGETKARADLAEAWKALEQRTEAEAAARSGADDLVVQAVACFDKALETFSSRSDRRHRASALYEMGVQYRRWGNYTDAAEKLKLAIEIASQMHAQRLVERYQAEERLTEEARKWSELLLEMKRQREDMRLLFYAAVHDINNVVFQVSEYGRLAAESASGDEFRRTAVAAADYLNRLCEGLLIVEKAGAGRLHVEKKPLVLREVVAEAFQVARSRLKSGVVAENAVAPGFLVSADRAHLSRTLVNLVGNAGKFTQEGHVKVSAAPGPSGSSVISVEDTGAGIAAEMRERVFDLFEQARDQHKLELQSASRTAERGYGIGLAYCKLAIQSHGGEIWVDPEATCRKGEDEQHPERHGTVFRFTLPGVQDAG